MIYIPTFLVLYLILPFYNLDFRATIRGISYFWILLGLGALLNNKKLQIKFLSPNVICFKKFSFIFHKNFVIFFLFLLMTYTSHLVLLLFHHKNALFLTENDFISMSEILNQTLRGNFFLDVFHGNLETGNYLAHHFTPSILILAPFLLIAETRIGYGYGLIFFVALTFFGFYLNIKGFSFKKKFFLLVLFTTNLYNYRLFTSYHFEILFLCFGLFWNWSIQLKKISFEIIFFILILALKEDISLYLAFYSFVFLFKKDFIRFISYFIVCILYYFLFIPFIWDVLDQSARVNWLENWLEYGNTTSEIFFYLLKNPSVIFYKFFSKRNVWINFLGSFSFLNVLNLQYLVSIFLILVIHLLSNRTWHNSLYHYYSYSLLPLVWLGLMESIQKFRIRSFHLHIFVGISFYFSSLDFHYPLKFLKPDPKLNLIQEAIQKIPENTSVQASHHIGIFISRKNSLYKLETQPFRDYILFCPSPFLNHEENHRAIEFLKSAEKKKEISLIFEKNSVKLYGKLKTH